MNRFSLFCLSITLFIGAAFYSPLSFAAKPIVVASKAFTEEFLMAELIAQTIERETVHSVTRKFGLGGTGLLFQALLSGEIQVYPEYTGTLAEAILKLGSNSTQDELRSKLETMGLVMSKPLGFNNTYALAVTKATAQKYQLTKISDLTKVAHRLRAAFDHEFMTRADGYLGLKARYRLSFGRKVQPVEHSLSYEAIAKREVDIIDVFTTDAKIDKLDLVVLEDDKHFFMRYEPVFIARKEFVESYPRVWEALSKLEGTIDEDAMMRLNAAVDLEKKSFGHVISRYLGDQTAVRDLQDSVKMRVLKRTQEHISLVGLAVLFSVLVGLPLGVLASRSVRLGQVILLISGMVQTIPSLALLCFLIPFFGIGTKPALVALFLYGLLPVVLNTFVGIKSIDSRLKETAVALGLRPLERLRLIEIPLAGQSILAGIRTSTVIGIGTATLAALIGAGGYGVPIITGLAMNDLNTVLIGAVPAAGLALIAHFFFEILSRWVVPRGMR